MGVRAQRSRTQRAGCLGTRRDLDDLIAGFDLALLQDAEIEAGSAVRDEQRRHLRFIHSDADPVAGDARLRHFEHGAPDPVSIANAHLAIGEAVDGEVLAELPMREVVSTEPVLPIMIRVDLIDENRPMLTAVPRQVALAIAVDIGFLAISSGSKYIELAGDEVDHRL